MIRLRFVFNNRFNYVSRRMELHQIQVLRRIGAYARGVFLSVIQRSKTVSSPGQAPHSHVGNGGLRRVTFGIDRRRKGVVIGPVKLSVPPRYDPDLNSITWTIPITARAVPGLLDRGGVARVVTRYLRPGGQTTRRNAYYGCRPIRAIPYEKTKAKLREIIATTPF
jgi:hypothetical protein